MRYQHKISSKTFEKLMKEDSQKALNFISAGFREIEKRDKVVEEMIINSNIVPLISLLESQNEKIYSHKKIWTAKVKVKKNVKDITLYSGGILEYDK